MLLSAICVTNPAPVSTTLVIKVTYSGLVRYRVLSIHVPMQYYLDMFISCLLLFYILLIRLMSCLLPGLSSADSMKLSLLTIRARTCEVPPACVYLSRIPILLRRDIISVLCIVSTILMCSVTVADCYTQNCACLHFVRYL
jgi:hypothetical protein